MLEELRNLSLHFLTIKNSAYRRYFIRTENLSHRLSVIIGQRGVGKTTTLVQSLLDYVEGDLHDPRILYVQADHFQLGLTSLYAITEQFQAYGGQYIAIDEIHKYPDWSKELKSIYDTFPHLKILASGSSALEIHRGTHDLTRRAIVYHLFGLSFREYLELTQNIDFDSYSIDELCLEHEKISRKITKILDEKNIKILPLFEKYLTSGYFPYFHEIKDEALYMLTLEQNLHTTIDSDLATIYPHLTTASLHKIKKLLIYIAKSVPFTPNWQKIMTVLEIGDNRTLKSYFSHLEDACLIRSLSKATEKFSLLESPDKVFLNNSNQLFAISSGSPESGTVRETFFLSMIAVRHQVDLPSHADFLVDDKYLFEIGGKNKSKHQLNQSEKGYLVCDNLEHGSGIKIPLWLFGFLY